MTNQQKMLIEKLKAGYRIFAVTNGIEIIGPKGTYQFLGNVAKKNMYKLATRDIVDAVYLTNTSLVEFRLTVPFDKPETAIVNPLEVALLDRILDAI